MPDSRPPDRDAPGPVDPHQPLPPGLDPRGRRAARSEARRRELAQEQASARDGASPVTRRGRPAGTPQPGGPQPGGPQPGGRQYPGPSAPGGRALPPEQRRAPAARREATRRPRDTYARLLLGTRAVAAFMSLAILIGAFWAWSTWRSFTSDIPHGNAVASTGKDIDGAAQNILLLGNDSRAGATPAELKALGTQNDGGSANTDTMMLMHIPANGAKATVISFPRDSYLEIPGFGMDKLNAAYPDGYNAAIQAGKPELDAESAGITLLAATLSQLTGLHIDHYVMIDLLGFYRISNAIGGVPVLLCQAQHEKNSGIDLPAGLSVIKGSQALAFVRQRYGFPDGLGDLDRIKRQQYFLTQVFHKVTSTGTLLNPLTLQNLLKAISSSLLTDPSIKILSLADDFQQMSAGNLSFQTVPTDGFADESVGSVVVVHPAQVQAFVENIVTDAAGTLAAAATVAPGTVTVDVLNGSDENGAASQNAATLRGAGFVIGQTGTAPSSSATTMIEYPAGMAGQAKTLAAYVPSATLAQSSSVRQVTLLLGSDGLHAVSSPPTAAPAPSPSPTAAATGTVGLANQHGCVE